MSAIPVSTLVYSEWPIWVREQSMVCLLHKVLLSYCCLFVILFFSSVFGFYGFFCCLGEITMCKVNRTMRFRDLAFWSFFKMAAGRHLGFDPTGNGAVRPAVPENPTLEPNMKGVGWRVAELWPFEIFPKCVNGPWGRSLVVGRRSVGRQYSYFLHWSHILLFRYVRDVAREE